MVIPSILASLSPPFFTPPSLPIPALGHLTMVEWDTLKAEGEMLEVAQAWLILPPTRWDLLDPGAAEPALGESQVVSFHLASFGVPMHPFMQRFLCHFGYGFMI
jgi:hypothetical protein